MWYPAICSCTTRFTCPLAHLFSLPGNFFHESRKLSEHNSLHTILSAAYDNELSGGQGGEGRRLCDTSYNVVGFHCRFYGISLL
jgi:hypothetical protein